MEINFTIDFKWRGEEDMTERRNVSAAGRTVMDADAVQWGGQMWLMGGTKGQHAYFDVVIIIFLINVLYNLKRSEITLFCYSCLEKQVN